MMAVYPYSESLERYLISGADRFGAVFCKLAARESLSGGEVYMGWML